MNCFCVEKTVVHVPIGGVLKEIVMFRLIGEYMVVRLESVLLGERNCPSTGSVNEKKMGGKRVAGRTRQTRCCMKSRQRIMTCWNSASYHVWTVSDPEIA